MNCIEIKNITKTFGSVRAVDNVSLRFEENTIYGLLGRNGAGKTTLLGLISNRLFPNSGEITVDGEPAQENDAAQGKLFLMSESNFYPDSMRVKEALQWTEKLYHGFDMAEAEYLASAFGLDTKKKIKSLSTGYGSIFKIVIALSVRAPYVLLDEPVLGLDANHRDLFYKLLLTQYEKHPCCYVISTHLIEEAAGIIENIVIIKDGVIIENCSCEELLSQGYTVSGRADAVDRYTSGKRVIGEDTLGGLKSAYVMEKPNRAETPEDVELSKLDLQKLFIQLTNS